MELHISKLPRAGPCWTAAIEPQWHIFEYILWKRCNNKFKTTFNTGKKLYAQAN